MNHNQLELIYKAHEALSQVTITERSLYEWWHTWEKQGLTEASAVPLLAVCVAGQRKFTEEHEWDALTDVLDHFLQVPPDLKHRLERTLQEQGVEIVKDAMSGDFFDVFIHHQGPALIVDLKAEECSIDPLHPDRVETGVRGGMRFEYYFVGSAKDSPEQMCERIVTGIRRKAHGAVGKLRMLGFANEHGFMLGAIFVTTNETETERFK